MSELIVLSKDVMLNTPAVQGVVTRTLTELFGCLSTQRIAICNDIYRLILCEETLDKE